MDKEYVCVGAGNHGRVVLDQLGEGRIQCFFDNYKNGNIGNIPIYGLDRIKEYLNYTVVLTADSNELRDELDKENIKYLDFNDTILWGKTLDDIYFDDYQNCEKYSIRIKRIENWFREPPFFSEKNKMLIEKMKRDEDFTEILKEDYDETLVWFDEYYDVRPEMRLIKQIIETMRHERIEICDIASGYGDLLRHLRSERINCYAVELDPRRAELLSKEGIECHVTDAEHTGYEDDAFDVVTCLACLEHVKNPFEVAREIYRIAKRGAYVFASVPLGNCLNCDSHVRDYLEDDLASVLVEAGFSDIRIMNMSYVNNDGRSLLFSECRKV